MGRTSQLKIDARHEADEGLDEHRFASGSRLNLNDLLKRRQEEKKVEKKTNLLIFSGATVVGVIVLTILVL